MNPGRHSRPGYVMVAKKRSRKAPKRAGAKARKAAPPPPIEVPAGWAVDAGGKSMSRPMKTQDFMEAIGIIHEIASIAEELQHHPDLHLERWNRLRITTYSHDVGHLTDRDLRLARRINEVLAKRGMAPF